MIPEDFTLRRHYLTELKFKQEKDFEYFTNVASEDKASTPLPQAHDSIPLSTIGLALAFVFLLVVIF